MIGSGFFQFVRVICRATRIDPFATRVEILYRRPHYTGNTAFFFLVRTGDEEDLDGLLEVAERLGSKKIQELYVRTCEELVEDNVMQRNAILPQYLKGKSIVATLLWKRKR